MRLTYSLIVAALAAGLLMTGCATVPLSSIPKLRGLNPETVDMSKLEMAVRLPAGVGIGEKGAYLTMKMDSPHAGETIAEVINFKTPDPELTDYLSRQAKAGQAIYRFKLTGDKLAAAESFRRKALDLRARSEGHKSEYTYLAYADYCSTNKADSLSELDLTFYIRTRPDKSFFKLFKEQNLVFKDKSGETMSMPLEPCGAVK